MWDLGEAAGDTEAAGDKEAIGDARLATEGISDTADADAADAFLWPGFRFWLHLPVFPQTHSFAAASHSAFCFLTEHLLPPTLDDLTGIVIRLILCNVRTFYFGFNFLI